MPETKPKAKDRDTVECRSLVGGALGDVPFEVGDMIPVPKAKIGEWRRAKLIEAPAGGQSTGGDS